MIFSTKILETLFVFNNLHKNVKIWSSNKTQKNVQYISVYYNNYKILFFLKNNLQNFYLSLIDICGVDISTLNINLLFKQNILFKFIFLYNLINYKTFSKFIFLFFKNTSIFSIDGLFFNANWLERELIEFFNINVFNKNDTRNLLLDYNFTGAPLLKTFPTEGYVELFFNFNTYNLDYINNEFIEL